MPLPGLHGVEDRYWVIMTSGTKFWPSPAPNQTALCRWILLLGRVEKKERERLLALANRATNDVQPDGEAVTTPSASAGSSDTTAHADGKSLKMSVIFRC